MQLKNTLFYDENKQQDKAPWYLLLLIMVTGTIFYFLSQSAIGGFVPSPCLIGDKLQNWTAGINHYLGSHDRVADAAIIFYSAIGDIYVLFFFIYAFWKRSIRIVLPLFIFLILRQILQSLVTFPIAPGLIWHYPGFPALFASYNISSDFYFSAYVGINLLVTLELLRFKIRWLTVLGFCIVFLEAFIDIILRSHYTPDIYTSIITAIFAFLFATPFADAIDGYLKNKFGSYTRFFLISLIIVGVILFYTVQYYIGKKPLSTCGIVDALHQLTLPLNQYITSHVSVGNALLITMNSILDTLTLFILALSLITRNIRPFLILTFFFMLRQSLQILVSLPLPPFTFWHYPGFPSLLQTYGIANDLYFSGHTGVSFIAALELARFKKPWLTTLGFSIFIYEVISVIVMQVHYTMDVFTAMMTVLCLTDLCSHIAQPINRWLTKLVHR